MITRSWEVLIPNMKVRLSIEALSNETFFFEVKIPQKPCCKGNVDKSTPKELPSEKVAVDKSNYEGNGNNLSSIGAALASNLLKDSPISSSNSVNSIGASSECSLFDNSSILFAIVLIQPVRPRKASNQIFCPFIVIIKLVYILGIDAFSRIIVYQDIPS